MFKRERPVEKVVIKSKRIKNRIKKKCADIIVEKVEKKEKEIEQKKEAIRDKSRFKADVLVVNQIWEWLGIK